MEETIVDGVAIGDLGFDVDRAAWGIRRDDRRSVAPEVLIGKKKLRIKLGEMTTELDRASMNRDDASNCGTEIGLERTGEATTGYWAEALELRNCGSMFGEEEGGRAATAMRQQQGERTVLSNREVVDPYVRGSYRQWKEQVTDGLGGQWSWLEGLQLGAAELERLEQQLRISNRFPDRIASDFQYLIGGGSGINGIINYFMGSGGESSANKEEFVAHWLFILIYKMHSKYVSATVVIAPNN
ncbi:hypothetical protein F0562_030230 [Nyssa sinensis]|uniref:Uncharacterized protein n=1 Tax=Nyssa sinensis TaxID=561372 RepID=A0A5J5B0E0_9ASTE|nr:hypothetical protein F0562_030230 [Nyssa sinensis]